MSDIISKHQGLENYMDIKQLTNTIDSGYIPPFIKMGIYILKNTSQVT